MKRTAAALACIAVAAFVALWPPGATCTYGEPARTDAVVGDWFGIVVAGLVLAFAVATALRGRPPQATL